MSVRVIEGDCLATLCALPPRTLQCCVTSPPYYGLRDYGCAGQIGLEPTPDDYVARLVDVFREVRRVLRDDGCLWLNLGDSYAASGVKSLGRNDAGRDFTGGGGNTEGSGNPGRQGVAALDYGAKPKDLLGIPWLVAFALRADGWFLRSAIVWHKPNPMPESVRDRPTSAYEHVFLLTKRSSYYYDAEAISEPAELADSGRESKVRGEFAGKGSAMPAREPFRAITKTRNARNVWTIATRPYSGAHFAAMPPDLAERCIKAGSKPGDTILDPFGGAGTTALVADRLNRNAIICELNPEYARLARERLTGDASLLAEVVTHA